VDEKPWREVPCDLHRLAKLLTSTILEIRVGRYLIALHEMPADEGLRWRWVLQGRVALRFATPVWHHRAGSVLRRTRQAVVGDADEDSGVVGEEAPVRMG
jgi:hypothetical protein